MAKKTPFELCPRCAPELEHRVSVVDKDGTPCYWCKTIVPMPKEG